MQGDRVTVSQNDDIDTEDVDNDDDMVDMEDVRWVEFEVYCCW